MKPRQPLFITISIVLFFITFAFAMFVDNYSFFLTLIYWMMNSIGILSTLIVHSLEKLVDIKKYNLLNESEKNQYNNLKKISYFERIRQSLLYKQNDIDENKIAIDHGFDGIIELDNPLPKWWVSLFFFGVVFCVSYIYLFFTNKNFVNPEYEFEISLKKAKEQQADYWSNVIQPTIETVKLNSEYIEEGKELFNINCVSCHNKEGIGGIGPNLTDENWINVEEKTLIQNIFHLIWNGSKNNLTMRGFGIEGELTGVQIEKIANYVYYINQMDKKSTKGAPPQGKKVLWEVLK